MFKYLKRQTSRRRSSHESLGDDVGNNKCVAVTGVGSGAGACAGSAVQKRDSLRSTTSFCDEVFLEELTQAAAVTAAEEETSLDVSCNSDAISCGAGSLSNGFVGTAADNEIFLYHSRLSMSLSSIVNEPNCLSYFIQYLETKNAFSLIKFYLNIENFKRAALSQLEKQLTKNDENSDEQHGDEVEMENEITLTTEMKKNVNDDIIIKKVTRTCLVENKDEMTNDNDGVNVNVDEDESISKSIEDEEECNKVPELKNICDLSMRKPLTDDEKSQIYAETNKQLKKCNNNQQQRPVKASSELSICSAVSSSLDAGSQQGYAISAASINDAIVIYQKYLIGNATQFVELPIAILAPISLKLCSSSSPSSSASAGAGTSDEIESKCISATCFDEARDYVLQQMEQKYVHEFLQSSYYCKYCVELIEGNDDASLKPLSIYDILYSEVTLFYFMEYLEQHGERECLDFWSAAINFRKGFSTPEQTKHEFYAVDAAATCDDSEAQADAMIIYERFFSLQSDCRFWMSDKLRCRVEQSICAPGQVALAFDLPLQVTAKYLEQKYFENFLKSQLFDTYLNELKTKIHKAQMELTKNVTIEAIPSFHKLSLRRNKPNKKASATHRKSMSDCTHISQHNTLLAAMDTTRTTNMNIDARQLTNPNLLWQRSNAPHSSNGTGGGGSGSGIIFGRVNSLGRYERDFEAVDAVMLKHNWSLSASGNKIKNAMRKLVNLPEDKVQEEIAWQVAEMIVKDVTNVTLKGKNSPQTL